MSIEVVVGPPVPGPDARRQITINTSFADSTNSHSDAVHVKTVLDKIDQEPEEETIKRAIKKVK